MRNVPAWKRVIARATACFLESLTDDGWRWRIGGGLRIRTMFPKAALPPAECWFLPQEEESGQHHEEEEDPSQLSDKKADFFIEFWSTTCGACLDQLPAVQAIHATYGHHSIPFIRFRMVHVEMDDGIHGSVIDQEIRDFCEKQGIRCPVAIDRRLPEDPESAWSLAKFTHIPHGVLISGDTGRVMWSGSLFTHEIAKVFRKHYGPPDRPHGIHEIQEEKAKVKIPKPLKGAGGGCQGGACEYKPKPKVKQLPSNDTLASL